MVVGVVTWLLEWLYGCWSGYMVVGVVIWLLERLYGCWSGYMVVGVVIWLLERLRGCWDKICYRLKFTCLAITLFLVMCYMVM